MAKKLKVDGSTATVSITNADNDNAITDPLNNLDDVHFHTDLPYVQFVDTITNTVTLSTVNREYYSYSSGGCF